MNKILLTCCVSTLLLVSSSCENTIVQRKTEVGNYIYEVDTVTVYTNSSEKTKLKTGTQFNRIVYSDVFQKGISAITLSDLDELRLAIGDKGGFNTMLIRSYLKNPDAEIPTDNEMRENPEAFVQETYRRFLLRNATPYELQYFSSMIEEVPSLTVQQVYEGFIRSNEYLYY